MIHQVKHPMAGKTVTIKSGNLKGHPYTIEDWHDRVIGQSWRTAVGNPACLQYAARIGSQEFHVPSNDNVVYGKIGAFGYLVHVSELDIL